MKIIKLQLGVAYDNNQRNLTQYHFSTLVFKNIRSFKIIQKYPFFCILTLKFIP